MRPKNVTDNVPTMYKQCAENVPDMFPSMFPKCAGNVSKVFQQCAGYFSKMCIKLDPKMYRKCVEHVSKMNMCQKCSQHV